MRLAAAAGNSAQQVAPALPEGYSQHNGRWSGSPSGGRRRLQARGCGHMSWHGTCGVQLRAACQLRQASKRSQQQALRCSCSRSASSSAADARLVLVLRSSLDARDQGDGAGRCASCAGLSPLLNGKGSGRRAPPQLRQLRTPASHFSPYQYIPADSEDSR